VKSNEGRKKTGASAQSNKGDHGEGENIRLGWGLGSVGGGKSFTRPPGTCG